jgi:hypothetical protein
MKQESLIWSWSIWAGAQHDLSARHGPNLWTHLFAPGYLPVKAGLCCSFLLLSKSSVYDLAKICQQETRWSKRAQENASVATHLVTSMCAKSFHFRHPRILPSQYQSVVLVYKDAATRRTEHQR